MTPGNAPLLECGLSTLYDRSPARAGVLPDALRRAYDGDLAFPRHPDRPCVIANFVETLDGIVSFGIAGQATGGEISGFDEADRFVMGLLRSCADAIVVGSGTLHGDPGHVRTPGFIYPPARELYARFRAEVVGTRADPMNVVVTASGRIDLSEPTFRTPGLATLVVTTELGRRRLLADHGPRLSVTRVSVVGEEGPVPPGAIVRLLGNEFGVGLLLHEGGPTLLGAFVDAGLLDELFLTLAPQLAGGDGGLRRPGLIEGVAFAPAAAPWFELLTVKRAGDHLFLRLGVRRAATQKIVK